MPVVYRQEFEVKGKGDIPFDMLRYDYCYPATSEDAVNLASSWYSDRPLDTRTIKLRRIVFGAKTMPTTARWKSFGWVVVLDSIHTYKA